MRGGKGSTAEKRGRAVALLATLLAPIVLYLIVRSVVVLVSPTAASALPPTSHTAALAPVLPATLSPKYKPDEGVDVLAGQAMVSAPVWYGAFVLKAKVAEQQGRLEEAIRLLEEVRRRRPKFLPARLQLIAHYGRTGRYADLLSEVDFALRYSRETRDILLPELAKLIANPGARAPIADMLAREPSWKADFFQIASTQKLQPSDVAALIRLRERQGADLSAERQLYVTALSNAGRVAEARTAWLQSLPASERRGNDLLFNGSFKTVKAPPAFNWRLHDTALGRAEITSSGAGVGALDVSYFGSSGAVLAEQTTALKPGRYVLAVNAQVLETTRSGALFWVLSCLPDSPELARINIANIGTRPRVARASFVVPTNCNGQVLKLVGEPGDIAVPINAQVFRVEIRDAN